MWKQIWIDVLLIMALIAFWLHHYIIVFVALAGAAMLIQYTQTSKQTTSHS